MQNDKPGIGELLAAVVGFGALGTSAVLGATGGEVVVTVIIAFVGASALNGWLLARKARLGQGPRR